MGITGFATFFKKLLDNPKNKHHIGKYCGKIAIVDLSLLIYRLCIAKIGEGFDIKRSDGKSVLHIFLLFHFFMNLMRKGIMPFSVFDGPFPILKKRIHIK